MAVADVYDALTSERPYKKAFSHEEAARIIAESSGTHFDPRLAGLFEQAATMFRPPRVSGVGKQANESSLNVKRGQQ
jgi:putative two-component system response regulator